MLESIKLEHFFIERRRKGATLFESRYNKREERKAGMKRIMSILALSTSLFLLSGCELTLNEDPLRTEVALDTAEVGAHIDGVTLGRVAEYNFGQAVVNRIETPIRGRVSIPNGDGPYPIVFIVHGVHPETVESKRYDTGFDHVVRHLAGRDIIAVSIDAEQVAHDENTYNERLTNLLRLHLDKWEQVNKGNHRAPVAMKGKADFNKIGLLGYSEGGVAILSAANTLKEEGYAVESLLSVAPKMTEPLAQWPEADISFLVPEYDYVAPEYDGILMYDFIPNQYDRLKVVTFLHRANHTFFNRAMTMNDVAQHGTNYEMKHQLKREEQEEFLRQYASDYFSGTLNRTETSLMRILETNVQPNLMYWQDITLRAQLPKSRSILPEKSTKEVEKMQERAEAVTVDVRRDAFDPKKDEMVLDTVTTNESPLDQRSLFQFVWEKKGATVEFQPTRDNFVGAQVLAIDFLIDPSDRNNQKVDFQNFGVELEDRHGNVTRAAIADDQNAMRVDDGGLELVEGTDGKEYKKWSKKTPLVSVRIPLTKYEMVDFEAVDKVRFYFSGHNKGSVYIDDIYIQ